MSNKRRKRSSANTKFFVYEPGVEVPRDVTHLFIPPGFEVLPDRVFCELRHLKEVVLSEGLREIGESTFSHCRWLERINFPSSLAKVGDFAFWRCTSLTVLLFPELVEIGEMAFSGCSLLNLISLTSTGTVIGDYAFAGCSSLETMKLAGGIRTIRQQAFVECALEDIIFSATLTEIGRSAFESCQSLRMVKLSGGIQLVQEDAFRGCIALNHISVASRCLVVTLAHDDINYSYSYNFNFMTDGTIASNSDHDRVVITSECFYSMSAAEVSALEINITGILHMPLEWDDKNDRLHGALAPHERRRKNEVASILELGLWRAEMLRSGGTGPGNRDVCRQMCGAGVVIENVFPFL